MSKNWRLTERTKTLLTLELAIVLPAAALMAFSIWNLKHIQRDKFIEAAIQRDFQSVLRIAEKKSWIRANELVEPIRKAFPSPDENPSEIKAGLDRILAEHPEIALVALYDKRRNVFIGRSQTGGRDENFCSHMQDQISMLQGWVSMQGPEIATHVRNMSEKGDDSPIFFGNWSIKKDSRTYDNEAMFIPPGTPTDRATLGILSFDQDYLQKTFFPSIMKHILSSKNEALRADANPPAMMIHPKGEYTPWV